MEVCCKNSFEKKDIGEIFLKKVSVITPCYNDGAYIEQTIKSIRAQTYKNWEMIIVDDGSDDVDTVEILEKLECETDIRIIRTNRLRPAGARNAGISVATGEFILPVDADDLIEPTYMECAVEKMISNPKLGIVYCHADLFGEKNGPWELPDYSFDKMLLDNVIFVTALFRRSDWEKVGGFRTSMKHGMEDYDFWLSILELDREVYQFPQVLFHYRIKPSSRTTQFQQSADIVKETYKDIYMQHPNLYEKYKDEYAVVLRNALIEHIFMNRAYAESVVILEKIKKLPLLKQFIKKFIMK